MKLQTNGMSINCQQNEDSDSAGNVNGNLPGMPMRPPFVGPPYARVVPLTPFPMPPFRPPHMLPRFPLPFIARPPPFRIPPRVFPPNSEYEYHIYAEKIFGDQSVLSAIIHNHKY